MCIVHLSTQNAFAIHLKYQNIWQQKMEKVFLDRDYFRSSQKESLSCNHHILLSVTLHLASVTKREIRHRLFIAAVNLKMIKVLLFLPKIKVQHCRIISSS